VKDGEEEKKPSAVSATTKRGGEMWDRWSWVEPLVWTERMLTALEQGVKGGTWYSLIDKVCRPAVLLRAFAKVKANKGAAGVDRQTVAMFEQRLDDNIKRLSEELIAGTYRPREIRRVMIPKPGEREGRPLGIPTVRDRVVQTALRMVLEPIFEVDFAEHSYGFRPGRGCKDALRQVERLLKAGFTWVVDVDLQRYFDTIDHDRLLDLVNERVSDSSIRTLIGAYLQQRIVDEVQAWVPGEGTPQGAVLSPLLSNIYLNPLDQLMARKGFDMIRYADDMVILCRNQAEAEQAFALVQRWVSEAALTLHPTKTRIVDATQRGGFDFLGYHFERKYRWPRKKSVQKLKDELRAKTKRTNGHSLESIITNVNPLLRGWFEYFKHGHYTTFRPLDGWLRMRLRSILRRRRGGKGRGRGADHQRWPNAFFAAYGLFSLATAHTAVCQSSRR